MRAARMLVLALILGVVYALGAHFTYQYLTAPGSSASFFPPAGLTLAVLIVTPRRTWPLWLAAIALAEFGLDVTQGGQTAFVAAGFAAANTIEPLVGASLICAANVRRPSSPRALLAQFVVFGAIVGPFFGGLIGGSVTALAGAGGFVATSAQWWLGDALGVLVVATPLIAWARRDYFEHAASMLELVGIAGVAAILTLVPPLWIHDSFAFAVLPVLMWAAIRGGPLGVGMSGFTVGFGASWVVATGNATSLMSARGSEAALVDTQLFIGVTILAALTLAVEAAERTRAERRLLRAETERVGAELSAMEAAATERRRIARETHDIVGHALNVMILSAAAARRVLHRDPQQATELLATVEDVGRDAFRDLDVALGLTDRSPDFIPLKGLADLEELVRRLVRAGMQVDYRVEGSPRPLPKLVDGSAFRIIQESLTNVAKHAVNAHTHVYVRYEPTTLVLEVSDLADRPDVVPARDRRGGAPRGLVGMRERVSVLGGRIEAGPVESGYLVTAELPLDPV
jgi:signal transduction histidine kinase